MPDTDRHDEPLSDKEIARAMKYMADYPVFAHEFTTSIEELQAQVATLTSERDEAIADRDSLQDEVGNLIPRVWRDKHPISYGEIPDLKEYLEANAESCVAACIAMDEMVEALQYCKMRSTSFMSSEMREALEDIREFCIDALAPIKDTP